jgi:hypothetical protein
MAFGPDHQSSDHSSNDCTSLLSTSDAPISAHTLVPAQASAPPLSRSVKASSPDVLCYCGVSARERTPSTESVNQGWRFWRCKSRTCAFFEWNDGTSFGSSIPVCTPRLGLQATTPEPRPVTESAPAPGSGSVHSSPPETESAFTRASPAIIAPLVSGPVSEPTVLCECGTPAGDRAHKGRRFLACKSRACGFFKWNEGSSSTPHPRSYSDQDDPPGDVLCYCNMPARMHVSTKRFW